MTINNRNFFFNKYVIVAFIVTLLNIFLVKEKYILDFFVIIEALFLIYLLLKKRFSEFLIWLLIFLSSSIEFRVLVTNDEIDIYGFKHFRIFGVNLGVLFVLISFFLILLNKKALNFRKKKYPNFTKLLFLFFILFCSGFLVGIFNIVINDNGIRNFPSFFSMFILETYMAIWPFLLFYMSYYCLVNFKNSDFIFKKGLLAVFIANCTAPLIPAILGVMGSYSHLPYMLISSSAMLSPFILLFVLYPEFEKYKSHFILLFFGGTILPMLFFNYSGGKLLIILLLLPIIYFFIKVKRKNKIIKPLFSFGLVGFFLFVFMNYLSTKPATLFESKSREVESIIDFGTTSTIEDLNPSVYFRAVEIVNLIEEYKLKPYYLFTGKGYMGSIKEHFLPFPFSEEGGFPAEQYRNGVFYSLHEFTSYFIKYGLLGFFVIWFIFKKVYKNINNNPWIIIGSYWFFVLYGFSLTISILGVTSLAYGFYKLDNNDQKLINEL